VNIRFIKKISNLKLISELKDDIGEIKILNDKTTSTLISKKLEKKAVFCNREEIVLCGNQLIENFIRRKFPKLKFESNYNDGDTLKKNTYFAQLTGDVRWILILERTLLNFIQHLSSISTLTRKYKKKLKKSSTKLLDTRKTTNGLRFLEKYATGIGGAENHRINLKDKILIKDNHIKVLGGISQVLKEVKQKKIKEFQIECETYSEVEKCINQKCKHILLDNMSIREIKKCISLGLSNKKKITFEISGGINLKNIEKYSLLGADYISTSKITNSAKTVDIGLDII